MATYPDGLSERKRQILKAVVEAHIEGGEPVGSKYIVQNNLLSCSSATIRNEMAELEQMGYLEQPHTSAGRVPSQLGYRYYVDALVEQYANTTRDIAQINLLLKNKMSEIDQILETASKLASSMTNYTGIAIKPKASMVTTARYELIPVDEFHFAMVLITSAGAVKTKKVKTDRSYRTSSLLTLGALLNEKLCGVGADGITLPIMMQIESEMNGEDTHLVGPAIKCIYEIMSEFDGGELRYSGLNHLLHYPEYADKDELSSLLGTLENQNEILDLVSEHENDDINVLIGLESSVKVMNNSSLVFKPIRKNGKTVGIIGVLGPRRMDYKKVLKTVEEIGGSITSMMDEGNQLSEGKQNGGDRDGRE